MYIYEVELYNLISGIPVGHEKWCGTITSLNFLYLSVFFQHSFLYNYFSREEDKMDASFFLRRTLNLLHPDVAGSSFKGISDNGFTTNQD